MVPILVRVIDAASTAAEQTVVDWLSAWRGPRSPHGMALVGASPAGYDEPQRFDIVVLTPTCCVVVDVVAPVDRWGGDLIVPRNGPWTVDDVPVGFDRADNRTPLDHSQDHTFSMQHWLADNGFGQRSVHGLVLLMPGPDDHPHVIQQWNDPGLTVLLGHSAAALRDYFAALAPSPSGAWTVNDVAGIFHALGASDRLPSGTELLAEGFLGPVDPTRWPTGPAAEPTRAIEPPDMYDDPRALDDRPRPRLPYSPWVIYPKAPGESHPGRAVARLTLALGMLIAFVWLVWFCVNVFAAIGSS